MQLLYKIRKRYKQTSYPVLSSQEAYRQWADKYPPLPHNPLMQAEHEGMKNLMPNLQNCTVLDLACGTGRWGKWALENGANFVIGIDNSISMLKSAELAQRMQADMTTLPLASNSIDVVLCGLALGHLPSYAMQATFHEFSRVLKLKGVALISDFHPILAWTGAQRTFQGKDGKTYAVQHHIHSYADYFAASQKANLQLTGVQEPVQPQTQKPLVLVLRLTKS
ncbi:MAG: hypothetical protein CUN55_12945 [Phototrophicales bacterium]|nr:MAG: hypothetical protein CUN55_12945 [Phototrophicales bacterium]